MRARAPIQYRRFVGDTEGLAKYPNDPPDPPKPTAPENGVSSRSKERWAMGLLVSGWVLASASLAGISGSLWVGLLTLSVGVLIAGVLEVYDLATTRGDAK